MSTKVGLLIKNRKILKENKKNRICTNCKIIKIRKTRKGKYYANCHICRQRGRKYNGKKEKKKWKFQENPTIIS